MLLVLNRHRQASPEAANESNRCKKGAPCAASSMRLITSPNCRPLNFKHSAPNSALTSLYFLAFAPTPCLCLCYEREGRLVERGRIGSGNTPLPLQHSLADTAEAAAWRSAATRLCHLLSSRLPPFLLFLFSPPSIPSSEVKDQLLSTMARASKSPSRISVKSYLKGCCRAVVGPDIQLLYNIKAGNSSEQARESNPRENRTRVARVRWPNKTRQLKNTFRV
jgi:hypothetical protein